MCRIAHIEPALLQEAADVLAAEAVSNAPDALAAERAAHLLQHRLEDRVHVLRQVVLQPAHQVEARWPIERGRVTVEEVGHHDEVAVGGELVGDTVGGRVSCGCSEGHGGIVDPFLGGTGGKEGVREQFVSAAAAAAGISG